MAGVEQDHLLGYALSHTEVFSGKVSLALFQWLVDLVGEVERLKGRCEALFHSITGDIHGGKGDSGEAKSLEFTLNPRCFGLVTLDPCRCVKVSERVEVFQ